LARLTKGGHHDRHQGHAHGAIAESIFDKDVAKSKSKKEFQTLQPEINETTASSGMKLSKSSMNVHGRKGLQMMQKKYKASPT